MINNKNSSTLSSSQIGAGSIRKVGKVDVLRASPKVLHHFKSRYAFVYPTLFSYCKDESELLKLNFFQDLDVKHDFPLAPNGQVLITASKSDFLILTLNQLYSYKEGTLKVELLQQHQIKIIKEITLKFESRDVRGDWMMTIMAECRKNYLRDLFLDTSICEDNFFIKAYNEIWGRFILDNRMDLARKVFIHSTGSTELKVLQKLITRIVHWMKKLLNVQKFEEEHAELFVAFFFPAVSHHAFRALLFLIEIGEGFLTDFIFSFPFLPDEVNTYQLKKHPGRVKFISSLKFVYAFSKAITGESWKPFTYFMIVVSHPCSPSKDDSSSKNALSQLEFEWINKTAPETFAWKVVEHIMKDCPFLAYHYVWNEIKDIMDDQKISHVVMNLEKMPSQYFLMSFATDVADVEIGDHFRALSTYCKYRESWKLFSVGSPLDREKFLNSNEFAEAVHSGLWMLLSRSKPHNLLTLFVPEKFETNINTYFFHHALHGEIISKLARNDPLISSIYRLNNANFEENYKEFSYDEYAQSRKHLTALRDFSDRVILWVEHLTGKLVDQLNESDAVLYLLLFTACVNSFALRALVWVFLPDSRMIEEYYAINFIENENIVHVEKSFLQWFLQQMNLLQESSQYLSFLLFLEHPYTEDNQNYRSFKLMMNKEVVWMNNTVTHSLQVMNWKLTWKDIGMLFTDITPFTYKLLLRRYLEQDAVHALAVCKCVPKFLFVSSFSSSRFKYEMIFQDANFNEIFDEDAESNVEVIECFDSHFVTFANAYRIHLIWSMIETEQMKLNREFNHALQCHLFDTVELIAIRSSRYEGIIKLFTPQIKIANMELLRFQDILPRSIANHLINQEEEWCSIFNLLYPTASLERTGSFLPPNIYHLDLFKEYLDLIVSWISVVVDEVELQGEHVTLFSMVLNEVCSNALFRAWIVLFRPEKGIAHVWCDESQTSPEEISRNHIEKTLKIFRSTDRMQSLLYILWLYKHPAVIKLNENSYKLNDCNWEDEVNWIEDHKSMSWELSKSEWELMMDDGAYLPFRIISRNFSVMKNNDELTQLLEEYQALPPNIESKLFKSEMNYFPYGTHRSDNSQIHSASHFSLLLKFCFFRELWKLFMTDLINPNSSSPFVHSVFHLVWSRVFSEEQSGLRMLFQFSKSGKSYARSTYLNVLQRKAIKIISAETTPNLYRLFSITSAQVLNNIIDVDDDINAHHMLTNQIYKWTQCLCGQQQLDSTHALFFVELLTACANDVAFRAFISIFLPSSSAIEEFQFGDIYTEIALISPTHPTVALVRYLANGLKAPAWKHYRQFLQVLKHPVKHPGLQDEMEPHWKEESAWLHRHLVNTDVILTWDELRLALQPTPFLCWLILTKDIHDDPEQAIEQLPAEYLMFSCDEPLGYDNDHEMISYQADNYQIYPFINMCLEENGNLFPIFLKKKLATDKFVEALLKSAFMDNYSPKLLRAYNILKQLMFEDNNAHNQLRKDTLCMIPNLAHVILTELYDIANRTTKDVRTMCNMVELLLFLEDARSFPQLSNIMTLTDLLKHDSRITEQFFDVIRELNFIRVLAQKCWKSKQYYEIDMKTQQISPSAGEVSSKHEIDHLIFGFFKICMRYGPSYFKTFIDNISSATSRSFFSIYLHPSQPLRMTLIHELLRILRISKTSHLTTALKKGWLLYDNDHFVSAALEALSMQVNRRRSATFNLSDHQFTELLIVAFYLHNIDDLKNRIERLVDSMLSDVQRARMAEKFLHWMIDIYVMKDIATHEKSNLPRMKWKHGESFVSFNLEDLFDCANQANVATQILRSSENHGGQETLERLFCHYVSNSSPSLWPLLFAQTKTIAYFIKYVDREDLDLAFKKFGDLNNENPYFKHHLKKVRRRLRDPIVSSEKLVELTTHGGHNADEQIIAYLKAMLSATKDLDDADMRLVCRLTASWMKITQSNVRVPLPPRNTQLITLMVCASWAKHLLLHNNTTMGKTVIAQVGTGEGKSLIIAMMAIYFVKVLKKRVHILVNNLGLLQKDYEGMKPLYREFNIKAENDGIDSPALKRTTLHALQRNDCRDEFCHFGVTYCLRRNLERYYQDSILDSVPHPFEHAVLIVDEVDDLIVDDTPNQEFSYPDCETELFKQACGLIKSNPNVMSQFDPNSVPLQLAQYAYEQAQSMEFRQHYDRRDNKYVRLDNLGNPVLAYDLGIEYLSYTELNTPPQLKTNYYVQSIPYLLSQYECITGFSGSLGSPSEREFLKIQYQAWCFDTPSFLNTCRDVIKVPPKLMDDPERRGYPCVHVFPTRADHIDKIVRIAARMYVKVPVLIIAQTTDEAYLIAEKLLEYIQILHPTEEEERRLPPGVNPSKFLQCFLKYKRNSTDVDENNWSTIIRDATQRCEDRFRITVTDYFGGRGHDFDMHDDEAESNGGLTVIMTSIPPSERDWKQWKGRTARRDNSGQYSVVLCTEDEIFRANSTSLVLADYQAEEDKNSCRYSEKVIDRLLELRDESQKNKLNSLSIAIEKGRLLNELCDKFYNENGAMNMNHWPDTDKEKILRNLLTRMNNNRQDIREGFNELGIISTSDKETATVSSTPNFYDSDPDADPEEATNDTQDDALRTNIDDMEDENDYDLTPVVSQSHHRREMAAVQQREESMGTIYESDESFVSPRNPLFVTPRTEMPRKTPFQQNNRLGSESLRQTVEFHEIYPSVATEHIASNVTDDEYDNEDAYQECHQSIELESAESTISASITEEMSQVVNAEVEINNEVNENFQYLDSTGSIDDTFPSSSLPQSSSEDPSYSSPSLSEFINNTPSEAVDNNTNVRPKSNAIRRGTFKNMYETAVVKSKDAIVTPNHMKQEAAKVSLPMSSVSIAQNQTSNLIKSQKGTANGDKRFQSMTPPSGNTNFPQPPSITTAAGLCSPLPPAPPATTSAVGNTLSSSSKLKPPPPPTRVVREKINTTSTLTVQSIEQLLTPISGTAATAPVNVTPSVTTFASNLPISIKEATTGTTTDVNKGGKVESTIASSDDRITGKSTSAITSAPTVTTGKTISNLMNASHTLKERSTLDTLRIGETMKYTCVVTEDTNDRLSRFVKRNQQQGEPLVTSVISMEDEAMLLPGYDIQGVILKTFAGYQLILNAKLANEDIQHDLSMYGRKKLRILCQNILVLEQVINLLPSRTVHPYTHFTFSNALTNRKIDKHGKITISTTTMTDETNTTPLFSPREIDYRGQETIAFPSDLPDCVLTVTVALRGYTNRALKYVYYQKDCIGETAQIFLSPNEGEGVLTEGEWRVVLKWNAEPRDLDLYCKIDFEPKLVYFMSKNAGGRANASKGNIELDIDVQSGFGPETITFTPNPSKKYRFFVRNYSASNNITTALPLYESGATITVYKPDDKIEQYTISEDIVLDKNRKQALFWHVFDIIKGKVNIINEVVADDLRNKSF